MSFRRKTRKRISDTRVMKKQLQEVFNKRAVFATGALRIFLGGANKIKDKNNPDVEMYNVLLSPPLARAVCEEMGWGFDVIGDGAPGFEWPGIATDMEAAEIIGPIHPTQAEALEEIKAEDGGPLIILGR